MASRRRVNMKALLANADLRRELMVSTIQATQAREGIETTREQANRAYYVVTESDNAAFFDLERFRGGKRAEPDQREEMFARSLRGEAERVRFDIARRDFAAIDSAPLAYRRVGLVAHIFREAPSLDPSAATVKQGLATSEDARWVRRHWEVLPASIGAEREWAPFAKGGGFSRFYADIYLVVHWADNGRKLKDYVVAKEGSESKRIYSQDWYFRSGLTWPRRTQRGLSVRALPAGCIFADKGPAIFPEHGADPWFLLGLVNSAPAEYLLKGLMSFGSWEVGVIKRLPVPTPNAALRKRLAGLAQGIHDAKAAWDTGNETSTRFDRPWALRENLNDLAVPTRLDRLAESESTEAERIQSLYADLNNEAYKLYGISEATRALIEETMGDRPPEILWPDMERKTADQKRMEHVWRLLSYVVGLVVLTDEDGIVPFTPASGEAALLDRVHDELARQFPGQDANKVEAEIVNELKKRVKGYKRVSSIREWLEDAFFDYHYSLYKKRPIYWHISSSQGTAPFAVGALCHYHKLDANRFAKLRASYLRDTIEHYKREVGRADQAGDAEQRVELQGKLEEAQALDRKLQQIQEGLCEGQEAGERDYRILTPWKAESERPKGWTPDIDDGVKVNIEPLQKAGVLRVVG